MRLRIGLLVPGRDEEAAVDATMQAILGSTRLPDEIVVADGRSKDRTVERLRAWQRPGVPLIIVDNPGLYCGAGRQAAFEASSADVLIAFDFGNRPDPGYFAAMARPFEEDPDIDFVAGIFRPIVETPFEECVAAIAYHDRYVFDRFTRAEIEARIPPKATNFPGTSVAWRRAAWLGAGGIPCWLPTYEDVTFSRKLVANGARLGEQGEAFVWHHMRSSLSAFRRMCFNYARGRGLTGSIDPRSLRVGVAYALMAGLLALAPLQPLALVAFALFVGVYLYRSGLRQLIVADRGVRSAGRLWTGVRITVARDLGTLGGNITGLWCWLTQPVWRRALRAYFGEGPRAPRATLRLAQ